MKAPPRTILLVEDNQDDVYLIQRAFKKAGLTKQLQVVNDGESALAYLAGDDQYSDRERYPLPGLLLLDLKLPLKHGTEILAWLRAQPSLKRLLVVILSSSQDPSDIDKAYELGANSYLVKPVSFDALVDMVKTLNLYWLVLSEQPGVWPASRKR